tara:strand:- start:999 stop:1109 length:111 start_codon:yes stop_codon:yes gene_type:complete
MRPLLPIIPMAVILLVPVRPERDLVILNLFQDPLIL